MHSRKSAAIQVFAVAGLVGIAGFLSIRANMPSASSPFAMLTTLPALFLSDADGSSDALFALSCLPIVIGFLLSSRRLFRQETEVPRRSVATLLAFTLMNVAWFSLSWSLGVEYQGLSHVLHVAAWNVIFITAALVLLLINSKTPRLETNLAFHGTLFVWLAWCAFPWLGEMP